MSTESSYVFSLSQFATPLFSDIEEMACRSMLPDVGMGLDFCYEMVTANIRDILNVGLHSRLGIGRVNYLDSLLESHLKAVYVNDHFKTRLEAILPHANIGISECDSLPILKLYAESDITGLHCYLDNFEPIHRGEVIRCIEGTWPYHSHSENNKDINHAVEQCLVKISDLAHFSHQRDFVTQHIDSNPYILWGIDVINRDTLCVRSEGDYRLLEWTNDHFRNNKYQP